MKPRGLVIPSARSWQDWTVTARLVAPGWARVNAARHAAGMVEYVTAVTSQTVPYFDEFTGTWRI